MPDPGNRNRESGILIVESRIQDLHGAKNRFSNISTSYKAVGIFSAIPPQKKKRKKKTNKQTNKTKEKTKTENTHALTLRNHPKHCDVCRMIFYHVVILLLTRGCQKRDYEVLQRDFVFA